MKVKVAQSCLTLCDPMDYIVHGILQARILEWVAFPFQGIFPTQESNPDPTLQVDIWLRMSSVPSMLRNQPAIEETQVLSLDQEDPLKESMVSHSSSLAWRIPKKEEPGGLQSLGLQGVRLD